MNVSSIEMTSNIVKKKLRREFLFTVKRIIMCILYRNINLEHEIRFHKGF